MILEKIILHEFENYSNDFTNIFSIIRKLLMFFEKISRFFFDYRFFLSQSVRQNIENVMFGNSYKICA